MKTSSNYIVNKLYDNILFIYAPLLSLLLGITISNTWFSNSQAGTLIEGNSYAAIFLGTLLMGHFLIGFIRTHGNREIFSLFPYRFTVVPLALFAGMLYSEPFLFACLIVSTLWDEWHSAQQTFGFCRIYDAKVKNNALTGRKLDIGLNSLIWFGPLLAGATLMEHVLDLENDVNRLSDIFFSAVPAYASTHSALITQCIIAIAIPYTVFYIFFYYKQWKKGYAISTQKTTLLIITAAVSIYAWGFNSFGEAFLIMNLFHYVQYYGLIWHLEKSTIITHLKLSNMRHNTVISLLSFITISLAAGYVLFSIRLDTQLLIALFTLISMMHFWYDSFTFSVRKKQL